MTASGLDDSALRTLMRSYLDTAGKLDEAATVGGEARDLLDLAEAKTVAALQLRKRLTELGWTAPTPERADL